VWGATRLNGVINITPNLRRTPRRSLSGGGGRHDHGIRLVSATAAKLGNVTYRVYGKGFTRGRIVFRSGDAHDRWSVRAAGALIGVQQRGHGLPFRATFFESPLRHRRTYRAKPPSPFFLYHLDRSDHNKAISSPLDNHHTDKDSGFSCKFIGSFRPKHYTFPGARRWATFDLDFHVQLQLGECQQCLWSGLPNHRCFSGQSGQRQRFLRSRSRPAAAICKSQALLSS